MVNNRQDDRYRVQLQIDSKGKEGVETYTTDDVCINGAFLLTKRPKPLRQLIQVVIHLPEDKTIKTFAQVVSRRGGRNLPGPRGMGVQFFSMNEDDRGLWEGFIGKLAEGEVEEEEIVSDVAETEEEDWFEIELDEEEEIIEIDDFEEEDDEDSEADAQAEEKKPVETSANDTSHDLSDAFDAYGEETDLDDLAAEADKELENVKKASETDEDDEEFEVVIDDEFIIEEEDEDDDGILFDDPEFEDETNQSGSVITIVEEEKQHVNLDDGNFSANFIVAPIDRKELRQIFKREISQGTLSVPTEEDINKGDEIRVVLVHPWTGAEYSVLGKIKDVNHKDNNVVGAEIDFDEMNLVPLAAYIRSGLLIEGENEEDIKANTRKRLNGVVDWLMDHFQDAENHFLLGLLHLSLGEGPEARKELARALLMDHKVPGEAIDATFR